VIPVWDIWVRLFHWALVATIVSNHFLNEGGGSVHEVLGYFACLLVLWRLFWGFRGRRAASFKQMFSVWPEKGQVRAHFKAYFLGRAPRTIEHPPIALIGMAVMFLLIFSLGITGWMTTWDRFFGEEWLEEFHGALGHLLVVIGALHVVGVIRESFVHRENLIASMIHGKKRSNEEIKN
jgi:cytochrome b